MERNFAFGALPGPDHEWMIGKTIEEIEAIQAEARETNKPAAEVAAGSDWKKRLS